MRVLMERCADPRGIAGQERRLEGLEPARGGTPGLFRELELVQGLVEIVHRRPAMGRCSLPTSFRIMLGRSGLPAHGGAVPASPP